MSGSALFAVARSIAINPGLAASFPWLSIQAQGWEQYRFNRLKYCYYTRTGTGVPGSIILAPDFDAADAAPANEQQASSYQGSIGEVPWVPEFSCDLRPSSMHALGQRKFVRQGNLSANQDIKTYDAGAMHVCTLDGTAVNWGKLWVEYDVEFFVAQTPASEPLSARVVGTGSVSKTAPFGTAAVITGGLPVAQTSGTVLTFNTPGQFLLAVEAAGTGLTTQAFTSTGTVATTLAPLINGASTAMAATYSLIITEPGQTLTLDAATSNTSVTAYELQIAQYQASLG